MIALTYRRPDGTRTSLFRERAAILTRHGEVDAEGLNGRRTGALHWFAGIPQTELSTTLNDPYLVAGPEGLVLLTRQGQLRHPGPLRLRARRKQYGGLVASEIYELLDLDSDEPLAVSQGGGWRIERHADLLGRFSLEIRILSAHDAAVFPESLPALGPRSRPSPLAERAR